MLFRSSLFFSNNVPTIFAGRPAFCNSASSASACSCLLYTSLSLSLAATQEIDVSFSSSGYLDVSVPRVPSAWLWIHHAVTEVSSARFPHSDTRGSLDICSSPRLFAAYHVFLRLLVPRHPPCALFSLTFAVSIYLHCKLPHTACSLLCSVTTAER